MIRILHCLVFVSLFLALGMTSSTAQDRALPSRDVLTYRLTDFVDETFAVLTYGKVDSIDAFASVAAEVVPSTWSGPIYFGLTWYWTKESMPFPGDLFYLGFSTSSVDTTAFSAPVLWLPSDVGSGNSNWSTVSQVGGVQYQFDFSHTGEDSIAVVINSVPDTLNCWRIELTVTPEGGAPVAKDGYFLDPFGRRRPLSSFVMRRAATDTLWYEVDALPRRRIQFRDDVPQNNYQLDRFEDNPVATDVGRIGGLKAHFRRRSP